MQPIQSLNSILHAIAAQAEMLLFLCAQTQPQNEQGVEEIADRLANNIVAKGLSSIVQ